MSQGRRGQSTQREPTQDRASVAIPGQVKPRIGGKQNHATKHGTQDFRAHARYATRIMEPMAGAGKKKRQSEATKTNNDETK